MGRQYPFRPFVYSLFEDPKGRNPNPLFGPGARESISQYILGTSSNPYTSALGQIGQTGNFDALPAELRNPYRQATTGLDDLIGRAQPVLASLIENGNPVDVSGVVRNRYANTILPQAAEQYNPASGTAFGNIANREAANLIAELEYPAQEAARQRQENALYTGAPAFAALNATRLGLPSAVLGEANNISQYTDQGARLLSALLGIMAGTPSQVGESESQPSGTAEIIGAITSLIGVCWVAEELFGVDDPRTHFARLWCHTHPDHPFVQQYVREGRVWADEVRANVSLRKLATPVWEWMAHEGAALAHAHAG